MTKRDSEVQASAKHDVSHLEDQGHNTTKETSPLKLDTHGLPLRPQPSNDTRDPLNWPFKLKLWVLFQVSYLAFLGPFTQAVINSAFVPVSKSFHISVTTASYCTNVAILGAGIAPLFLAPIANVYGRRPVFLVVTAVGVASHAASAAAATWSGVLVARFFVGVGTSAGMGIGAACVADMFFMHERGRFMGVYTVFVTNGAHVAGMIGGPIAKYLGWRWCFWIPAIILGSAWVLLLVALPETLYHRNNSTGESLQESGSWLRLFTFRSQAGTAKRKLKLWDFTHVFLMLRYPSVLFPALYYAIHFGLGSLAIGLSTFIGTLIGEISAGPVSDRLVYLHAKAHNGDINPESRLYATIPGAILIPIGVIIEGLCFQFKTHYMGPVMGIAIAAVGLQIVTTNIYAYITDCYKPQSAEISTLLNFGRQVFSFTLGFYMIPFAEKTTFGIAWAVVAICGLSLYSGVVILMFRGRRWREQLGAPSFHRNL
ncbi:hypothetical protein SLS63_010086 [Diaporthe eres]|uniref:Major facilitator superfamily (MFS) profile domain-containing protein n=1 Tax=Diaporthe eres TaxID=83184 RepID=A0ABR1NY08_DIAER